jgi:putative mRNA 3-end processing factor
MKIKCLGGFREVGKNAVLVEGKENVVFDYGVKVETGDVPNPVEKLDNIILGHAHLDHCGSIPMLYRKFKIPIFSTISTFEQAHLLLKDSLKIARIKEFVKHFGESDIEKMKKNEARVTYGQRFEAENFSLDVFDAGHIPGSTAPLLEMNNKKILYVSDFNTNPTRLLNGARIDVKDVDVLILESTYSNRNHPDRRETEKKFFETVEGTIANEGIAILPCFAVGRAAEILMILDSFKPKFPIYLDGMAKGATQIALDYPEFIKDPKALRKAVNDVKPIYSNDERKKITKEPCVIVTSSGMLEGGPSVSYIKYLYDNPESSIVFTGFLIPRTAGRYLVDTGRFVTEGFDLKIKMGIHQFDFSVMPETPVLVRDFEKTQLCPIKDVANNFDIDTLECYAFDKENLKSGWHKVSSIIKHNYSGKLYKIRTKTGREVEITQGHSVFVLRNGNIVDVPGEEVKIGDYIAIPKKVSSEATIKSLDMSKCFKYNVITAPKHILITNKLCRLLGYYVAEGHAIDRIGISLNSKTEQGIAKEIRDCIGSIFSNLAVLDYHPNSSELQLRFGGTLTARIFEELCGRGAQNKKSPDFLFQASAEQILEFVGAYLTGDGWFEGGKIRAKSKSKKLIDDLIYLLLQVGIIAKYDGIRIAKERKAPQGTLFKESISHVLRIQGIKDIEILLPFLRGKIRNDVESQLKTVKVIWSAPPHGLPVRELDIKNSLKVYNWRIEKILRSSTRNHINPNLIKGEEIKNQFLKDVINGDVAFDLIKNIEESDYNGEVYDLSVPGPQNFLGGFGGIFLHNSAHSGRDNLFDFVNKIRPEKVICLHGDNCERFATELRGRGFDAIAPKNGDVIDIH